jgi:HK97 family phage prohead protease
MSEISGGDERSIPPQAGGIEFRSSTITEVNTRQRLVDLIAVPWNQEAQVVWQGDVWKEVFTRGAFPGIETAKGVRVNREHHVGDTVGKVIAFEDAAEGLLSQVKIANTSRGEETLALADEDMISASVGFTVKKPSDVQINSRTRERRVMRAFLHHLAMVESPAYEGAHVLAVRGEPSGLQVVEQEAPPSTPALDVFRDDEVFAWARRRLENRP